MSERTHLCAVKACNISIPLRFLMCARHWQVVPLQLQLEVWLYSRAGQENVPGLITRGYANAKRRAIAAVEASPR